MSDIFKNIEQICSGDIIINYSKLTSLSTDLRDFYHEQIKMLFESLNEESMGMGLPGGLKINTTKFFLIYNSLIDTEILTNKRGSSIEKIIN